MVPRRATPAGAARSRMVPRMTGKPKNGFFILHDWGNRKSKLGQGGRTRRAGDCGIEYAGACFRLFGGLILRTAAAWAVEGVSMPSQEKPESCPTCGVEPILRSTCPICGQGIWVLNHGGHYMGGAREVVECRCSRRGIMGKKASSGSKYRIRYDARQKAYIKRPRRREASTVPKPSYNAVTTPEMAKKAAEGLARGLSVKRAKEEAGYSWTACHKGGSCQQSCVWLRCISWREIQHPAAGSVLLTSKMFSACEDFGFMARQRRL
jgi:hypothetical protein